MAKRIAALRAKVDRNKLYPVVDGLILVKENAKAKFNESVDAVINLGIDARKSDQLVRGALVLPNGTGKTTRVAVFAQGAQAEAAKAAGADIVGFLFGTVEIGLVLINICCFTIIVGCFTVNIFLFTVDV